MLEERSVFFARSAGSVKNVRSSKFKTLYYQRIINELTFYSPLHLPVKVYVILTIEEFYKLKYCSTVVYMVPRA